VDYPVALTILAALGDISRFRDGDHAASYLGLAPSTHQSGDHCYHGPITKRGNSKARWMLIQAAQHVASHPGPLGVFFRRLQKKKNRNVAVVATARKLVVIAWHILTHNEPYRYSLPRPTQDKLARLRIKATGKRRVGGTKKGEPRPANYGTGKTARRIPALPTVYQQEGLPPARSLDQLPKGEKQALAALQVEPFVQAIQQPAEQPRRAGTQKAKESPAMAGR
jgi:hypothetical protein